MIAPWQMNWAEGFVGALLTFRGSSPNLVSIPG